jgi:FtsZ-binding cell division protein ZapB
MPMEVLHILEEKIARLIESKKKDVELISALKKEISGLQQDNESLKKNVEKLEQSLLAYDTNATALNQERELAKIAVDDLIGSIDALIGEESPT